MEVNMIRKLLIFSFLAATLVACNSNLPVAEPTANPSYPNATEVTQQTSSDPLNNSYLPEPGDSALSRGKVFIDSSDLLIMESYPIQVALALKGSLPTPCNQLRVVANPPDGQNRIQVEVYSVVDPEQMCVQVLEPFEVNLNLGSFPTGHYTVLVNGEVVGKFDS